MKSSFYRNQSHEKLTKKIVLISFSILLIVLFSYQVGKGSYYLRRAQNNYVRVIPLYSLRGSIFDRNGVVLAKDRASFNLAVFPYQIKNEKNDLLQKIAQDLNIDQEMLNKNYKKNLRGYFSPTNIVTNIDKKEAFKLKGVYSKGLFINPVPQRRYLKPLDSAHLLGYVKKASSLQKQFKKYGYKPLERIGIYGVEQYYDSYLKGKDGGDLIEVDAKGSVVGFLGRKRAQRGKDLYLTIDSKAQDIARQSLAGKKGSIILLDSNSGELIVLYSSPSFDPNYFIEGKNLSSIYENKDSPLINRATQSTFPIGSLIKPLLALAGLEEGKIKSSTTFDCKGQFILGNNRFGCWSTHGSQDLYQALAHSCNVYFYNLGLILGPKNISSWLKKFGLNSKTFIDLPYEKKGFVPSPEWKKEKFSQSWYSGDTLNLSIGQGYLQITPIAITLAINSIANGGYLIEPILLKKIEEKKALPVFKKALAVNSENINIVKEGLRKVVSQASGSARMLKNLSLGVSGKTGTAQTRGKPHGWFVGFFPYQEPKYTISVFLENGGSSHQAVRVAYVFLNKLKQNNIIK
jgi:penicillin-binding protein 2